MAKYTYPNGTVLDFTYEEHVDDTNNANLKQELKNELLRLTSHWTAMGNPQEAKNQFYDYMVTTYSSGESIIRFGMDSALSVIEALSPTLYKLAIGYDISSLPTALKGVVDTKLANDIQQAALTENQEVEELADELAGFLIIHLLRNDPQYYAKYTFETEDGITLKDSDQEHNDTVAQINQLGLGYLLV